MDFRVCMWYTMASGVLRQGLLCSSEWLGTHYIDHTGLELTDPSASSWVLGLRGMCQHACLIPSLYNELNIEVRKDAF